jgi:hypothetical protein
MKGGGGMTGKAKLAVDIPTETKQALADLAHENRLNLTQMIVKLVEDAKNGKRK